MWKEPSSNQAAERPSDRRVAVLTVRFGEADRPAWTAAAERWLPAVERERAQTMTADVRARHVIGRAVLRLLAAGSQASELSTAPATLGIREAPDPTLLTVATTPDGKPLLADTPDLHVSIAHTGSLVVLAICHGTEVGVDVESPLTPRPRPHELVARFFAEAETQRFALLDAEQAQRELVRYWTIKEAVGKALGEGVTPALSGVVLEPAHDGLRIVSTVLGPAPERWTIHQLTAPDGPEVIAVALPRPQVPLGSVTLVSYDALVAGELEG